MENEEISKFYAIPLIGGILCQFAILGINLYMFPMILPGYHPYERPDFPLSLIIFLGPVIIDLIFGILMIVSAVKIKNRKTTLIEEKKKLLIFAWIVVSVSLGQSIISIFWFGTFFLFQEPGLVGGLIIILGNLFYTHVNKRTSMLNQEKAKSEPTTMKEQQSILIRAECTNCGFKSEQEALKFCPECGNRMVSE